MDRVIVRTPSSALKIDILQGRLLACPRDRFAKASFSQADTLTLDVDDAERERLVSYGATVYEDVQFAIFPDHDAAPDEEYEWVEPSSDCGIGGLSLSDVLDDIQAPLAWAASRGRGVTVAVIDTGVSSGLREVDAARRSPFDLATAYAGQHWSDSIGHGSMCAAIAAGSRVAGGRYDGVAPEATVLAARSSLRSSDLLDIYDELLRARAERRLNGPLVVTNSYGLRACHPLHVLPVDHPFLSGILAAIADGVFVCFAAGNNHRDACGHDPAACGPNSIWGANSHDRVVSVGTVNRDLTNCDPLTPHVNSSRGPGEWAQRLPKPDCVAPTYGEVPWGSTYRTMQWWGTSGACPQVAGLAALMLAVAPAMCPDEIGDMIRRTCRRLPLGPTCVGRGLIDCGAAVAAAVGTT